MPQTKKQWIILITFAFIGWAYCGAIMGFGQTVMAIGPLLIVHIFATPVGFCCLSMLYFNRYPQASALLTAIFWTGFVIIMDAGLVAPVFEKSFDMFKSPLGTWIPFALIFCTTWQTGKMKGKKN